MTHTHILDFRSPESRSRRRCGTKGAELAALARQAMPVPEGFIVTADAVSSSSFEPELSHKLGEYLDRSSTLWAVHASPTLEGPELEGDTLRHERPLTVSTGEVAAAIRQVRSSVSSERASCRRSQRHEACMAVIVQKLVPAETAGTCSTVHPGWQKDRMFVYANYGLAESVVRGMAMPDTHVVDRQTLEPTIDIIGSKRMQVVVAPGGTVEAGVRRDMQRRFCLVPAQIGAIARLAREVEAQRAKAVDIEWAYREERLYLLDVRDPKP